MNQDNPDLVKEDAAVRVEQSDVNAALARLDVEDRSSARRALVRAARLYGEARRHRTRRERREDDERAQMTRDAQGKETLAQIITSAFAASDDAATAVRRIARIISMRGIPKFLSCFQRLGLWLFVRFAGLFPWLAVRVVRVFIRRKTAAMILRGETEALRRYVRARKRRGFRLNVNRLGETISGEVEADERTRGDVALLGWPEIECLSVKASTLCPGLATMAFEPAVAAMAERLRSRLRAAKAHRRPTTSAGDRGYKRVDVDMEEYRDLPATVAAFKRVLDEEEFLDLQAGLAIQAYLRDSYELVEDLLRWAKARVARGGAPIRLRIVKGANLVAELATAKANGTACPTFSEKVDSDANWKAVIELVTRPENIAVCHLGIATHNIFDLAWAALLIDERGVKDQCLFEMLEGMVNHVCREVQGRVGDVLLYAPAVAADRFSKAIAYLMRRFDELTDPDNFLSHAFGIEPGSSEWNRLALIFIESVRRMPTIRPARRQ